MDGAMDGVGPGGAFAEYGDCFCGRVVVIRRREMDDVKLMPDRVMKK
jgi:hypothetical protein